jgi:hypothetical protein
LEQQRAHWNDADHKNGVPPHQENKGLYVAETVPLCRSSAGSGNRPILSRGFLSRAGHDKQRSEWSFTAVAQFWWMEKTDAVVRCGWRPFAGHRMRASSVRYRWNALMVAREP